MNILDEKPGTSNQGQMSRIQTLIIGRLMVIFLLLVTTWYWYSGTLRLSFESFPQGLFLVRVIDLETREMLVQKIMVGK